MTDLGLLILRLVTGPLLVGHGTQKLFGWFGGHGLKGTVGWVESLGLAPPRLWAVLAGLTESISGGLTALGLFHPLGPIVMFAPMSMALAKVHWGKPIWVASGGGELPITNMAIATSQILTGPGRLSLDRALGVKLPWPAVALGAGVIGTGIALGLASRPLPRPVSEERLAGELRSQPQHATEVRTT